MICRVTVEFFVHNTEAAEMDLGSQVDAWIAYCRDYDGQARRNVEQQARWVRDWLDHLKAREPTPAACVDWLRHVTRRNTLAPQTVRNRITACRRFCGWLVIQEVLKSNPWASVPAPRGRSGQGQDALTDAQIDALVAKAQAKAKDGRKPSDRASALNRANLYRFLQLTGVRRGEARAQLWSDIDMQSRTMIVTADKARRRDAVPLSAAACLLLSGLARTGAKVFPRMVTDKALRADLSACGIVGRYSWHSFRAGYITAAFEAGTPPELIQRLVRHRSIDQTHRYLRHKEERLRDAAERRGEKIGNLCSTENHGVDTVRVHSPMGDSSNNSANYSTTSPSAERRSVSAHTGAGLRFVRSRSDTCAPTNEKARVRGREPLVSRGDRICNCTLTRVVERLLELNTRDSVMLAGALLWQQGATREGRNDSGPCGVGEDCRGLFHCDAEPRQHGRDVGCDEDSADCQGSAG